MKKMTPPLNLGAQIPFLGTQKTCTFTFGYSANQIKLPSYLFQSHQDSEALDKYQKIANAHGKLLTEHFFLIILVISLFS